MAGKRSITKFVANIVKNSLVPTSRGQIFILDEDCEMGHLSWPMFYVAESGL